MTGYMPIVTEVTAFYMAIDGIEDPPLVEDLRYLCEKFYANYFNPTTFYDPAIGIPALIALRYCAATNPDLSHLPDEAKGTFSHLQLVLPVTDPMTDFRFLIQTKTNRAATLARHYFVEYVTQVIGVGSGRVTHVNTGRASLG